MSGKRQFNEATVLDSAMVVFRQKGYAGTGMAELEDATGLNKSSIYNAFRNKQGLYVACLKRIHEVYTQKGLEALEDPDFERALYNLCDRFFGGLDREGTPGGCMMTLASLEMGNEGGEVSAVLGEAIQDKLEQVSRRCEQAIKDGQLDALWQPDVAAATVVAIMRGAIVLSMATGDWAVGRRAYQGLLAALLNKSVEDLQPCA